MEERLNLRNKCLVSELEGDTSDGAPFFFLPATKSLRFNIFHFVATQLWSSHLILYKIGL